MEMTEEQITAYLIHLSAAIKTNSLVIETLQQEYIRLTGRRYTV